MAGLQEKTTYRSAPFPSGGSGVGNALQKTTTEEATSKLVRETASWTWPDLTLKYQYQLLIGFPSMVETCFPCVVEMAEDLDITLDNLAGLRK